MIKKIFEKNYLTVLLLICFSIVFNTFYASKGVFPIDTFYHYDTGFRVLNNELPIRDYWVTSGILVDLIEAFFFKIFGVSWLSHVLHASIINALIVVFTFFVLKKFNLNSFYSFCYSLLFGMLAYPPSGTPFVDHHAIFLLLGGTYIFLLGIKTEKYIYWLVLPWFFGASFLCKQVPAAYMLIFTSFFFIIYTIIKKDFVPVLISFFSATFFILIIFIIGGFLKINYIDFFIQYILYPPSIGSQRVEDFNINWNSFFNHYKFIIIPFILAIGLNYKEIIKKKINRNDLFLTSVVFIFLLSSVFHQVLTKNQIFINFLSPLVFAYLTIVLQKKKYKNKEIILPLFLIVTILITMKYHYRFNEKRKFHELYSVSLKNALPGQSIHPQLSGLQWITHQYKSDPKKEIEMIKLFLKVISEDKREKMVITHYLFINALINESLNLPSRSFTMDGTSFPIKGNKYFANYKKFFNNKIKNKKIEVIYIFGKELGDETVTNYLRKECNRYSKQEKYFRIYEIEKNCFK